MALALPKLGVSDVIINSGHHYTTVGKPDRQRYVEQLFAAASRGARPPEVFVRPGWSPHLRARRITARFALRRDSCLDNFSPEQLSRDVSRDSLR